MSRHSDGRIILPATIGMPPWNNEGRTRERLPEDGETEECILCLTREGNAYLAWPAGLPVNNISAFLVLSHDGDPIVTLIPANPHNVVIESWREGNSTIIKLAPRL